MINYISLYTKIIINTVLLICLSWQVNANNSFSINSNGGVKAEYNAFYSKQNIVDAPNHINLIEKAQLNNYTLDSIYTTEKMSFNYEKRKWFFYYENGILKQREKLFFGEMFNEKYIESHHWYYNSELQLELFEAYFKPNSRIDTFISGQSLKNYYENGLLIESVEKKLTGSSSGMSIDLNGDTVFSYEPYFSEVEYFYKYNEHQLLTVCYWRDINAHDGRIYIDESEDYLYNVFKYKYNENGQLKNRLSMEYIVGNYENTNYTYTLTDSSSLISEIAYNFNSPFSEDFNTDSVSYWWTKKEYHTIFDVAGRDSIYSFYSESYKGRIVNQKIAYKYNSKQQLSKEVYYLWDTNTSNGNWYEQMNVFYTYDDFGNLIHYEKKYYDLQYNKWLLYEEHEYFYSHDLLTDIASNKVNDVLKVYPNPTSSVLFIEGIEQPIEYVIINSIGRTVKKGTIDNNQINVSVLERGVYLLKINSQLYSNSIRFMKK